MKINLYGISYNFTDLELILISIFIVLTFYFILKSLTKKKEIRYLTSNFLDDLSFENDPKDLSAKIIEKLRKNFKFTAYSYMFFNATEIDFNVTLSEKFLIYLLKISEERYLSP